MTSSSALNKRATSIANESGPVHRQATLCAARFSNEAELRSWPRRRSPAFAGKFVINNVNMPISALRGRYG